jgi:hypothetical protein
LGCGGPRICFSCAIRRKEKLPVIELIIEVVVRGRGLQVVLLKLLGRR